jgi:hypothetical protein
VTDSTPPLHDSIADAVAAFDAANHAFGRFVTYAVRPRGDVPARIQAVRELLQEAALAVPQEPTRPAAAEFLIALRAARHGVAGFLASPPAGYPLEEALPATGALDEAIEVLERALRSPA